MICRLLLALCLYSTTVAASLSYAQTPEVDARQAKLEAALAQMLSGATLEGSFTLTGAGGDAGRLAREKYTLGEVKKLDGNLWLIPARIQYGDKDVQLPLSLPIEWAGDTPVVVVDQVGLPGLGAVSARVMFFADHYAGYWQHGAKGGNLFGTIHRAENSSDAAAGAAE
jgi:hypothetical protein